MKIEFEFPELDNDTSKLIPEFCKLIVSEIRQEIRMNLRDSKLQMREKNLLNASWIRWKDKPDHINMLKLGAFIADSIICRQMRNNHYVIEINPKILMPNTMNQLSQIARFLDRGSLYTSPMYFINTIFMKYRKKLNSYWRSFIQIRLNRLNVDSIIIIK